MTYNSDHNPGNDLVKDALSYYADLNAARRKWRELMTFKMYNEAWRLCESIYDQLEARLLEQTPAPDDCIENSRKKLKYYERTKGIQPWQSVRLAETRGLDGEVLVIANRLFMSKFTRALDKIDALHYSDTRLRYNKNPEGDQGRSSLVKGRNLPSEG